MGVGNCVLRRRYQGLYMLPKDFMLEPLVKMMSEAIFSLQ